MSCAGSSVPDRRDRRSLSRGRSVRHLGTAVFAATDAGVGEARRWLTGRLGTAHPAGADVVLLLSEAFTNSVLHGTGSMVEVSAFAEPDVVRVEVVDEGGATLPHYVDDPCGDGGRGLHIMRALACDWGFEVAGHGRLKVWFDVDHTGRDKH